MGTCDPDRGSQLESLLLGEEATSDCSEERTFDWLGRPVIHGRKLGGWKASMSLLVANSLNSLAVSGCSMNLVLYFVRVLHQGNVSAANTVTNWIGTTFLTSLIGGTLGDAYFGRLWTCIMYQILLVMGFILLAISATITSLRPPDPTCEYDSPGCQSVEVSVFYVSLYMIGLGMASYSPNSISFGADQFDLPADKSSFMNFYMAAGNVGMLLSTTVISYIENEGRWALGFWLSAGAGTVAFLFFLVGTPSSRQYSPGRNPLSRIAQVIVAAALNWRAEAPSHDQFLNVEPSDKLCSIPGSPRIRRSESLRWLDKAATITTNDRHDECRLDSRRLICTVTQVEEVKSICRTMPFWVCAICFSAVMTQKGTLFVLQGAAMDNRVGSLVIPPSSMGLFSLLTVILGAPLYTCIVVPWIGRLRGRSKDVTPLERIGLGMVISVIGMFVAAGVEWKRLGIANKRSAEDSTTMVPMSIFWLVPQYVLDGCAVFFFSCGHLDFTYSQSPATMRSLGTAMSLSSFALGNYLSSLIMIMVNAITTRGGSSGWLPKDLNDGHLDYFYWLLDLFLGLTFIVFLIFAKWHKEIQVVSDQQSDERSDD